MTTTFDRRTALRAGAAAGALLATGLRLPAQAATTPSIPEVTVRAGAVAYTNHAWIVLAAQKGFLADVGITMAGNAPRILRDQQIVPQLQNDELDISTMYFGLITQAIDKITNIKPVMSYSYWQGNTILTSPNQGYKTVDEFMAEGQSWEEAAASAMRQLEGKQFAVTANPSTYPWNDFAFSLAGLSMSDAQTIPIEDPKAVQLAINEQIPFAAPGGAVQIYQLQYQAGWKPVMSTRQMVEFMPGGPGSSLNNLLNYDAMICSQSYIDNNRPTLYRWCSAMYRTMEYMFGPAQEQALSEYAPFINANTGAELDWQAIKFIFEVLDPFFEWKHQSDIWENPDYPLYYRNIYDYQVEKYISDGTLPDQAYDLEALFRAKPIFFEMRAMKDATEGLLAKLEGQTLSAERQALVDAARQHHARFNYYDAQRFAEAATA